MLFKSPWLLILIPLAAAGLVVWHRRKREPSLRFPSKMLLASVAAGWKVQFRELPFVLRVLAAVLFGIALAGPRSVLEEHVVRGEGIDIVLTIDASGSMAAEDFTLNNRRVNRLEVVKNVVENFVSRREFDRLGLVVFSKYAYTACPLTTDYDWLKENLGHVRLGLIEDGTAIGSAMASSVARLEHSEAKAKVVILLTDGINNAGKVDPVDAARAAQAMGIKIYAIGAGSQGLVPFPAQDFFGRTVYQRVHIDLDEKTLKEIADITGGQYFRAADSESLVKIYKEIDALEKTEIEELGFRETKELFPEFLWTGLGVLLLELILSNTILLKVP